MLDGLQRRGSCASILPTNLDIVGMGLGDTRSNRANTDARNEFDADTRPRVNLLQIIDQLGQVFDAVYIMMRRGGDQRDLRGGVGQSRNKRGYICRRQVSTLAWVLS